MQGGGVGRLHAKEATLQIVEPTQSAECDGWSWRRRRDNVVIIVVNKST
jgi:hypothetical protein